MDKSLQGHMDCVDSVNKRVFEFKCCKTLDNDHVLQLGLYMYLFEISSLDPPGDDSDSSERDDDGDKDDDDEDDNDDDDRFLDVDAIDFDDPMFDPNLLMVDGGDILGYMGGRE